MARACNGPKQQECSDLPRAQEIRTWQNYFRHAAMLTGSPASLHKLENEVPENRERTRGFVRDSMLSPRALCAQEVFQNEHLHKKGGGGVPIRMV
jgi:hypothetical protein